jgi:uncharacterized protein YbjT (DUF2867 family)
VQGSLDSPPTVDEALTGVSTVVLVTPPAVAEELNVIDRAAHSDVSHIVKVTSKASADSPIARRRWQTEIEGALTSSGLAHTLLRSNAQSQNFLMLAPAIKTGTFASATGKGRVGLVDARDVGEVAAVIATTPDAHAGRTYWPSGPEALSYADAAAVLSEVLKRPITFQEITFAQNKEAMIKAGVPEQLAEMNAEAFRLISEGDSEFVTDDVPTLLGRSARTFKQFVADYAKAFS